MSEGARSDERALEEPLLRACAAGRAAWPDVPLSPAVFASRIREAMREGGEPLAAPDGLCLGDLYLACACCEGGRAAIEAFERAYLSQVPSFLARTMPDPVLADEVKQVLRARLLVAEPGARPQLAGYSGRGALMMWLRVATLRAAWKLRGRQDAGDRDGQLAVEALPDERDPELAYLKERYGDAFQKATRDAFAALTSRQRNLLRMHLVARLSDEKIGALFHVHQSTVSRWMAAARRDVFDETRRLLRERLHVTPAELDSLVGMLRSQLDVSLVGLLAQTGG